MGTDAWGQHLKCVGRSCTARLKAGRARMLILRTSVVCYGTDAIPNAEAFRVLPLARIDM